MATGEALERADKAGGLSALLRDHARVAPLSLAIADAPDKKERGLGPPRSLTYAQADAAVSALADCLIFMGVKPGASVALQGPHTVEFMLAALACERAGFTVALTPYAWRRAELASAFQGVAVDAVIGSWNGRKDCSHALTALNPRDADLCFAFTFGAEAADDLIGLDHCFSHTNDDGFTDALQPPGLFLNFAPRTGGSPAIVPRTGQDILTISKGVVKGARLTDKSVLLSPFPMSGLTGLAGFLAPWLICGGALHLHIPFQPALFAAQMKSEHFIYTAAPAGVLDRLDGLSQLAFEVHGLPPTNGTLITPQARPYLLNLAEFALAMRGAGQTPERLPLGGFHGEDGALLMETRVRGKMLRPSAHSLLTGELCVRGPSAAMQTKTLTVYNPGAGLADPEGYVNTGLPCVFADAAMSSLTCVAEPKVARVGGFAVDMYELDKLYAGFPGVSDAAAFTIGDPLMGERIFAALAPLPGSALAEADFYDYLSVLDVAAFKHPEKLVLVTYIPRGAEGAVQRDRILDHAAPLEPKRANNVLGAS
jgi:acyl-CoA synthetase (AMP-forming)/AMP-acid ligase II